MDKDCYTHFIERMEKKSSIPRIITHYKFLYYLKNKRFLILLAFGIFILVYYTFTRSENYDQLLSESAYSACNIPDLDPYDPSISKYLFSPDPVHCNVTGDLVYLDERDLIRFNKTAMALIENGRGRVICTYQTVIRPSGNDDDVTYSESKPLFDQHKVESDFFEVKCHDSAGKIAYNNVFSHVFRNPDINKLLFHRTVDKTQRELYSILIFGLDSVSHLNGLRKLKKTLEYFQKDMNGYLFRGYTKIADNTFPNLMPILTGKSPYRTPQELPDRRLNVDNYPFIWKNFTKQGYVTSFCEDMPDLSIFNYKGKGFRESPMDHYMRPYWLATKKTFFVNTLFSPLWLALENRNVHFGKSSPLCYGSSMKHMKIVNYVRDFFEKYREFPRFSFSWLTQIGHDHLNTVELCDRDLYTLFKTLRETAALDNSFVFLLSDHGHRFDAIRGTLIGRIEERMPLLGITIPNRLRKQYPELHRVLSENQNRLTNPYDVHETLTDILHGTYNSASKVKRLRNQPNSDRRGFSLFEPIPKERSCASANIPEGYCACYKSSSINFTDPDIQFIGNHIVDRVNALTESHRYQCSELELKSITDAQRIQTNLDSVQEKSNWWNVFQMSSAPTNPEFEQFLIAVETSPSGAIFETTVNYQKESKAIELVGDINRINRYGNQSACIDSIKLKLYCYCNQ